MRCIYIFISSSQNKTYTLALKCNGNSYKNIIPTDTSCAVISECVASFTETLNLCCGLFAIVRTCFFRTLLAHVFICKIVIYSSQSNRICELYGVLLEHDQNAPLIYYASVRVYQICLFPC